MTPAHDLNDALRLLGYALGIGLLIGIERGWTNRDEAAGARVAGFRTFGLLGVIGGAAGLIGPVFGAVLLGAAAIIMIMGYYRESSNGRGVSATNMLAALLTLLLGALATQGRPVEALAAAAVITLLLSMRETLHRWLKGMSEAEIRSVARFALISFVILPLLPDRAMGPYDAWNPRALWFVVVLVSGLSFAGYVASRRFGATHGLLITAVCGAVVSSTAVTAAYARRLGSGDGESGPLIAGIALASLVMFVRVQLLTAVLAPFALGSLAIVMVPGLIVAAAFALLALYRAKGGSAADRMKLGNPMELGAALVLALLLAALAVVSRWAEQWLGDAGIAVVLALTGLMDVDAAVITLSGLPPGTIDPNLAGIILAAPIMLNTLVKAGMAMLFAPGRMGVLAAIPLLASVTASAIAIWVIW